ncbi:MAG: bacillithiol biosynthesis deacetylase BshB1 [Bacteroidetes bacterium]|nr:bacillithiol biosynthesis deacetylase BshB1 [Bacteroidota bacterium]
MSETNLHLLAFAAHPDDVELAASGTIISHIQQGYRCGVIDLTRGELGTRGNIESREAEAAASTKIMGLSVRDNLDLGDGFFEINQTTLMAVVTQIRKYKPSIVLANAVSDRHPDHGRAAALVSRACFLAGLPKIETGTYQAHRPKAVYHYIQDRFIKPDVIVDITAVFEQKMTAIKAFKTQFYDPNSAEPETPISSKEFMEFLEARSLEYGRTIGTKYGEGFTTERTLGTQTLTTLL